MHGVERAFDYNVLSNGAAASDGDNELLFGHPLPSAVVREAVSTFQQVEGIAVYGTTFGEVDGIFANNTAAPDKGSPLATHFQQMTLDDVTAHDFGVIPLWIPENPSLRDTVVEWLDRHLTHASYTTNGNFVDIIAPGVNKGAGIAELLAFIGLTDYQLYTFGDSWNDLPMHAVADVSHSFDFSPDDVKDATDHVISHVADVLYELA